MMTLLVRIIGYPKLNNNYVYVFCEELRLVGGNSCQGRLEVKIAPSTVFGQACDLNTGNNEAMVICNQLPGCSGVGAQRVIATQ